MPHTYAVTRGLAQALPLHGQNQTTAFDKACPGDAFVVGIDGEASTGGLHDVTIHCAEILITGSIGNFTLSYGLITTLTVDGNNSGAAYNDLLTAPKIVDRYRGRSGAWVDAIGIGEADVQLVLQP